MSCKSFLLKCSMEGGDLFSRVVGGENMDEEEARRVTRMILLAVEYLHNNNIAHRDLKVCRTSRD